MSKINRTMEPGAANCTRCRVLLSDQFNSTIPITLPIYHKSLITIAVTVFPYSLNGNITRKIIIITNNHYESSSSSSSLACTTRVRSNKRQKPQEWPVLSHIKCRVIVRLWDFRSFCTVLNHVMRTSWQSFLMLHRKRNQNLLGIYIVLHSC